MLQARVRVTTADVTRDHDHFDNLEEVLESIESQIFDEAESMLLELVSERLHSTRKEYLENVHIDDYDCTFTLSPQAAHLEEGYHGYDMLPGLLKSANIAKDGSRYKIVPFKILAPAEEQSERQRQIKKSFKAQLFHAGGSIKNIYRDTNTGDPINGHIGTFNFNQPHNVPHRLPGERSYLGGVQLFQMVRNDQIIKEATTFRVASSKHIGTGKWWHKGFEGFGIMRDLQNFIELQKSRYLKEYGLI